MQRITGLATAPPTAPAAPNTAAAPAAPPPPPFALGESSMGGAGGGTIGRTGAAPLAIPAKRSSSPPASSPVAAFGSGTVTAVWHFGHFTRRPAASAGTLSDLPQESHANLIRPSSLITGVEPGSSGGGDDGISTTSPHFGHFPRLPALAAGTRMRAPQLH